MLNHTTMLSLSPNNVAMNRSMGRDYNPDELRAALRRFMDSRDLKPGPWAKAAGLRDNAFYNFLNRRSQSLSYPTLLKLARNQRVTVSEMTGESNFRTLSQINVVGAVEAGVFKESMEYDRGHQRTISVPIEPPEGARIFALDVVGPSMNQEYPDGAIVIVCSIHDYPGTLENGDHVIVERRKTDGVIEATCKELVVDEESQEAWLWPRSDHPKYQEPIRIGWPGEGGEINSDTVEITGIVIGHFESRKHFFLSKPR